MNKTDKIFGYDKNLLYMVHVTDFFPKNHKILTTYDGNKIVDKKISGDEITIFLGDKSKNVNVPMHRHTVHFTVNTYVRDTGDGRGNWDGVPMAIIEPIAKHIEQILSISEGDSYTLGSIELSSDAIIIISDKALDLIPADEQDKWKFIVTEKNIQEAIPDFFVQNNLPLLPYFNHAGHSHSIPYSLEQNLQDRDAAINYVTDNAFDGKRDIEFSIEEFSEIISVLQEPKNRLMCARGNEYYYDNFRRASNTPQDFSFFDEHEKFLRVILDIIGGGFKLTENGTVKLKSDDEIYTFLQNADQIKSSPYKNRREIYGSFITDFMKEPLELYSKYIDVLSKKPRDTLEDFEKEFMQQNIQVVHEKEQSELTDVEKNILNSCTSYVLNAKRAELSEQELEIAKSMKPKSLMINDRYYVDLSSTIDKEVQINIGGNSTEDYEYLKSKFGNITGCYELADIFNVDILGEQDNETIGEFYSRVQGVIDAFSEITTSDEDIGKFFEFNDMGVVDKRQQEKGNPLLADAIEATTDTVRTSQISEQISNIKQNYRNEKDKDKEME